MGRRRGGPQVVNHRCRRKSQRSPPPGNRRRGRSRSRGKFHLLLPLVLVLVLLPEARNGRGCGGPEPPRLPLLLLTTRAPTRGMESLNGRLGLFIHQVPMPPPEARNGRGWWRARLFPLPPVAPRSLLLPPPELPESRNQ